MTFRSDGVPHYIEDAPTARIAIPTGVPEFIDESPTRKISVDIPHEAVMGWAVAVIWSLVAAALLCGFLGCSVDASGFLGATPLARGATDANVPRGTSPDVKNGESDLGPLPPPDGTGGTQGGQDTDGGAGSLPDAGSDGVLPPPSECPADGGVNRSLSQCASDGTKQLCRYYDSDGHTVYAFGCLAEGKLCVKACPL